MIIYTDGACQGNGSKNSRGGFGVVVLDKDENLVYYYNIISYNYLLKFKWELAHSFSL